MHSSSAHYNRLAFPSTTGTSFNFAGTQPGTGTGGTTTQAQPPAFGSNTFGKPTTMQPSTTSTTFPTNTFGGVNAPVTSFGTNLGTFGGMQSSMFSMGAQSNQGQQNNLSLSNNIRQEEYRGQSRFVEYRSKYAPYLDLTKHEWDMPTDGIQIGASCDDMFFFLLFTFCIVSIVKKFTQHRFIENSSSSCISFFTLILFKYQVLMERISHSIKII